MECTSRFNFSRLAVIVVLSLTIFSEVLLLTLKAASSSSPQGRTYSILESTYQEQVIKVEGVENLDSESFPQGLGIKIKNVSDKPVYFITLYVTVYFNQRFGDRDKTGMIFNFGSGRLISFNELANLQDPHIKPGETYVLTLDDKSSSNFRNHVSDMKIPVSAMRRLTLNFQNIRFGDGTGFSGGIFYPGKKIASIMRSVMMESDSGAGPTTESSSVLSFSPASFKELVPALGCNSYIP